MADSASAEWQALAERISARHRGRDSLIRGVGVIGDYARSQVWDASLLQILLFRHRDGALIDEGAVTTENGVSVTVDSITSGSLVELEELLHLEPLAGQLADMHTLRMADPTLRDILATFRDRYYSAEGRQLRAARALQRARVSLDDSEAAARPIDALEAVRSGIFPAVSAIVSEPVDVLRMPRRMRAAGRLLKLTDLWPRVQDALQLDEVGAEQRWASVDSLHSLAKSHLDARMPEVGAALLPRLDRARNPARQGSEALLEVGDASGATWTAIAAAAELDAIIEAASPGWRERNDYQQRAVDVYGSPSITELRRVCVEVQSRVN